VPPSLMIAQPTNNLPAKTKVWKIEYDFEYDPANKTKMFRNILLPLYI
jgi:hypothetical protein